MHAALQTSLWTLYVSGKHDYHAYVNSRTGQEFHGTLLLFDDSSTTRSVNLLHEELCIDWYTHVFIWDIGIQRNKYQANCQACQVAGHELVGQDQGVGLKVVLHLISSMVPVPTMANRNLSSLLSWKNFEANDSVPEYQDGMEVTDKRKSGIQRTKNNTIEFLADYFSKKWEMNYQVTNN